MLAGTAANLQNAKGTGKRAFEHRENRLLVLLAGGGGFMK